MSDHEISIPGLGKLPKIDKRDLDSVRGFLPGKLLGRTAIFVSGDI
jgi:hypothetical protein